MTSAGEHGAHPAQLALQVVVRHVGQEDQQQAFASFRQFLPRQLKGALAAAALGQGEQAAKTGVGRTISRVGEDRQAVGQLQPAADHEADADLLGPGVGARDSGHRIVVANGQGVVA